MTRGGPEGGLKLGNCMGPGTPSLAPACKLRRMMCSSLISPRFEVIVATVHRTVAVVRTIEMEERVTSDNKYGALTPYGRRMINILYEKNLRNSSDDIHNGVWYVWSYYGMQSSQVNNHIMNMTMSHNRRIGRMQVMPLQK